MNKNFLIYKITNTINNKSYVGITTMRLEDRFKFHSKYNTSGILCKAIKKYGADKFKIEVIFNAFTEKDMIEIENYFIKQHNTLSPNGYNLKEGGFYGKFSQEAKNKMSETWKNKWKTQRNTEHLKKFDNYRIAYIENKKKPIVGINRLTGEITEFNTINEAMDKFNNLDIHACLTRKNIYAGEYFWFYKSEDYLTIYEQYKLKYPYLCFSIKRINISTKEEKIYKCLDDIDNEFSRSCVLRALKKERKTYLGYEWHYFNK